MHMKSPELLLRRSERSDKVLTARSARDQCAKKTFFEWDEKGEKLQLRIDFMHGKIHAVVRVDADVTKDVPRVKLGCPLGTVRSEAHKFVITFFTLPNAEHAYLDCAEYTPCWVAPGVNQQGTHGKSNAGVKVL